MGSNSQKGLGSSQDQDQDQSGIHKEMGADFWLKFWLNSIQSLDGLTFGSNVGKTFV